MSILRNAFAPILTLVLCLGINSPVRAGDPLFNLSWYLREIVVVTAIPLEEFLDWRNKSAFESEFAMREKATADSIWIGIKSRPKNIFSASCENFEVSTYADWQTQNSIDLDTVPQWREAWHGVASMARNKRKFLSSSRVRSIDLVAAVKLPGIPAAAFNESTDGSLRSEILETAGHYSGTGFDRMSAVVMPMKMRLIKQTSCKGFELYFWKFES